MYIPKSTAYSTPVSGPLRNRAPETDSRQHATNPPTPIHAINPANDDRRQSAQLERKPSPKNYEKIASKTVGPGRRLFELNPKLDRKTQTAIQSYESLQYLNEAEQRESVSRLLGIDLYA